MRLLSLRRVTDAIDTLVERVDPMPAAAPQPLDAWIDRVVAEGVSSSEVALRMTVKNLLIVAALRDGLEFDFAAQALAAMQKYEALARESEATAVRLDRAPGAAFEARVLRPQVHRRLALALRDQMGDRVRIATIIEEARGDAWNEVDDALRARLRSLGYAPIFTGSALAA